MAKLSFEVGGRPHGARSGDILITRDRIGIVCGEVGVLGFDHEAAVLMGKQLLEHAQKLMRIKIDLDRAARNGVGGVVLGKATKRVRNAARGAKK